jgi:NSS family neurotransmitter:Na+ symporter
MLAMLGMAVGTGNIWRFPRISASNGGGEFLVAWAAFLFLWSIPLILLEFGLGRKTRSGPVRAFIRMMGPKWAWMGAFAVFVTTAISFYYSVVSGWMLHYTFATVTGRVPEAVPGEYWTEFTQSYWPVLTHGLMFGLAVWVVRHGVKAIERVTFVLMPTLIILVLVLTGRALTLEGAGGGLSYMFSVDWARLGEPTIWIEALTQNAWDTGAGWGLVLCYAAYLREREDTALNAFILPTANNLISLLAGIMVFCTVFSVVPQIIQQAESQPETLRALSPELDSAVKEGEPFGPELLQRTIFSSKTGNTGLTFIWMPQLFRQLPGGPLFMLIFFVALTFAAFSSLIAMVEVTTRSLVDAGVTREKAICGIGVAGFLLGLPSAISLKVLNNQDWVWSVGLMLSGLFFALALIRHGVQQFRKEHINHEDSNVTVGRWWDYMIGILVPLEAVFLIVWFLYTAWEADPDNWLKPFDPDHIGNVGTVLFQFAVVLVVLVVLNRWISRKVLEHSQKEHGG